MFCLFVRMICCAVGVVIGIDVQLAAAFEQCMDSKVRQTRTNTKNNLVSDHALSIHQFNIWRV